MHGPDCEGVRNVLRRIQMIQGIVRGALAIMLVITLITLGLGIFVVPAAPVEAASPTGTIWAGGYNVDGELGNGTNTDSNIPVQVSLPSGVTMTNIAAGDGDCLALASNGTVWAWGDNSAGELGNGTNTDSDIPVKVSMPSGVTITNIAAGGTTVCPSRLMGRSGLGAIPNLENRTTG